MKVGDRILGWLWRQAACHHGAALVYALCPARNAYPGRLSDRACWPSDATLNSVAITVFLAISDYAAFVRSVPIRNYDEHAPYIDAVRRGDVEALFPLGAAHL